MKAETVKMAFAVVLLFSFLFCGIPVQSAKAQFLGSVYIASDGSVVGTNAIQRNGSIYTLTANISGGIQVQKSNIVIDGAGYTVQGNGVGRGLDLSNGVGEDPLRSVISNVTLKSLRIVGFGFGVETNGGGNHTFYGNYIANCSEDGIRLIACSYNNITYCTVEDGTVSMVYSANYNTVTKSNLLNSSITVWLSGYETVDSDYWSDYLTKYPNAKEIGNTGVWDTPYNYGNYGDLIDNHPLMKPASTPITEFPDGKGETEPFPTALVVAVAITIVVGVAVGLTVYFKKTKR
jgi:hypothetical protein